MREPSSHLHVTVGNVEAQAKRLDAYIAERMRDRDPERADAAATCQRALMKVCDALQSLRESHGPPVTWPTCPECGQRAVEGEHARMETIGVMSMRTFKPHPAGARYRCENDHWFDKDGKPADRLEDITVDARFDGLPT